MSERLSRADTRREGLALHMAGLALILVAPGMALSALVAWGAGGEATGALVGSSVLTAVVGGVLFGVTRVPARVGSGAALSAVAITWMVVSLFGALPYVLAETFAHWDEALFESVSGFTGTGSTVLAATHGAGRGILFWRSLSQWYGGMGVIVLAVAVLPFIGVGGLELIKAEAPGPTSDRLAPRVRETAKRLWLLYAGLSLAAFGVFVGVGMSVYDAVVHSFTVVSTGGLSPYNDSIGHFDSVAVEVAVIVLMLAAATSFTLHWRAVRGEPGAYLRSASFRLYLGLFAVATAFVTLVLWADGTALDGSIRDASFTVAALLSSTGYVTTDFAIWAPAAQAVLFCLMVVGGMAASTSGGLKLFRANVMIRHAGRELRRVRHARVVLTLKLGRTTVEERIVARIAGFVLLYLVLIIAGVLIVAALGSDVTTATSGVVSMIGNMGPGLGEAGPASNYLVFSRPARAVLAAWMLLGRLELFAIVVLFVPGYRAAGQWRHRAQHRVATRAG